MVECPECGNEYEQVGIHWSRGSCSYPSFSGHQREIITGLLMGDGNICRFNDNSNPLIESGMISENYLKYVDDEFGILGNGVTVYKTAEESANKARDRGFSRNAKVENYHNMYRWRSRNHPELQEFSNWYSSGSKVWPDNIKLTPTVLKHWYCGDGHWENSGTSNRIRIGMSNEHKHTDKVDDMFRQVELPKPNNYNINKYESHTHCEALFTVEQSKKLWEYMGEPLPDFEYKWPEEYRKI